MLGLKSKCAVIALAFAFAGSAQAEEFIFKHDQGETVIAAKPESVFVTDWAAFDNLSALGVAVGGVPASNAPAYLASQVAADAAKIGSLQEPDYEAIAAANPDLVIIGARSRTAYPTMSQITTTIDSSVANNDIINAVKGRLGQYGEIFDVEDKAAELIANLDAKVAEAKAAVAGKGSALIVITNAGKLGIYGPESRVSWIYNTLEIPSVYEKVSDKDHGGDGISFEYLVEKNPDWLYVIDRDAGVGNEGSAKAMLDNELLASTTFMSKDQIVYLDSQAAYVTMHGYQGLIILLDQIIAAVK